MKIIDCVQGSKEWFAAKCGVPSASNFDKIIQVDGKPSKQREKYLFQLAGEAITGIVEETYQNGAMLRGKALENEAREAYRFISGSKVTQVGFCIRQGCGASPDSLVNRNGLLEIKCPKMETHVEYLLQNKAPQEYFQQRQGQLWVTELSWIDFMSYYPGLNSLIVREYKDKRFQKILSIELDKFCRELKQVIKKLKKE